MSTLKLSLAIIGGLVLASVIAYNAWITRRNEPRTASEHLPLSGDALTSQEDSSLDCNEDGLDSLAADRIEPVLGEINKASLDATDGRLAAAHSSIPADAAAGAGEKARTISPQAAQRAVASPPAPALIFTVGTNSDRKLRLDALIDVITPLDPDMTVSGDAVLAALPPTRRVGSKPFAVEGLSDISGEWESPIAGARYQLLQAGVQLANRAGALNDIEFSEFLAKTQAFADAVGAATDFPDMRAEVARARELDAFASVHDAQLVFMLRARRSAWSPGYVAQQAARAGFVPGSLPGRMVLPSLQAGQAALLSLNFDAYAAMAEDPDKSALREVSLSLDVAHVSRSEQPFFHLRKAASILADAMDGVVTDDAGQSLTIEVMDQIGADLEGLYDVLDNRGLSAGSAQARRLFS